MPDGTALLIAPSQRTQAVLDKIPAKFDRFRERYREEFGGSYDLGWLLRTESGYRWLTWGNAKDKPRALQRARDIVAEKGPMECLVWDRTLPESLTAEQVEEIRRAQV